MLNRYKVRAAHALRSARERVRRTPWPPDSASDTGRRVAVVVVNYETRDLISHLLFSLYRILGRDEFTQIVVVDNGSLDGSVDTLAAMHDADLLHLIANRRQRYHGPALNQALSWLARRQADLPGSEKIDFVWLLDSDIVVLRRLVLTDAVDAMRRSGAVLAGQPGLDGTDEGLVWLSSLLLDPARVYVPRYPPFQDHGAPATLMQRAVAAAGMPVERFPFIDQHYVLHLGRGTLGHIARAGDRRNRFYRWAADRPDPHYSGHPLGKHLHHAVLQLYAEAVPSDTTEGLVSACEERSLLAVPHVDTLPPVTWLREQRDRGVDVTAYLTEQPTTD